MAEEDIIRFLIKIIYGVLVIIVVFILWSTWIRIRNDFLQGGLIRILFTLIKLVIIIGIIVFAIQYAEKQGYFAQLVSYFF